METATDLDDDLSVLERKWERITDVPEHPRSTMNVIEYGLGKQRRAEVYVNRLLCYLLDPEQPHGMGTDFLEAFLDGLPQTCEFEEDTYDLSDVRVREQVPVWSDPAEKQGDTSPGYLDLLLDVPNEWFLLIELKFSAAETGTEFYCQASQFDDALTHEYESGQYYLYVHQADQPEASGECFANLTWRAFVTDILEPFLAEAAPRYPQRTAVQLHNLKADIQKIAGMSDQSSSDREKVALYLEHVEAISDVTKTFDDAWEDYSRQWGEAMGSSLDHEFVVAETGDTEVYTSVTVERDSGEDERWIFLDSGGDWQHVFKYGWRRREREDDILIERAEDHNDLRIGFYHRMGEGSNRDIAVRENELRFNFRCMGSNPTEFRDINNKRFSERSAAIDECLAPTKAMRTGQKRTLIRGSYPIDLYEEADFFDAYTVALNDAFIELVVENPELIDLLGAIFDDSIQEFR